MTKEEALNLTVGSQVFVHSSPIHVADTEVAKVYDTVQTVVAVHDFKGDIMVDVDGCVAALYWDEVDFIEVKPIDNVDEYEVSDISELFGGGI